MSSVIDELRAEVKRHAITPANYARLASVKAQYDPSNLFHINQNIAPAGAPMLSTFHEDGSRRPLDRS